MRDLVGEGGDPDAPNYQRLLKRYRGGLASIRNAMRADLGIAQLHAELPD
jgi:hypothetical protein